MKKFEISIIIPAYNEKEYIGICLQSLVRQKTKRNFEVVLVDNNSTDDTKKIAESFKDNLNIRVITEKQQGRGIARWRGFEESTGDILFSTDADTILPANWIEDFMGYFNDKKIVAVTSLCNIDDSSKKNRMLFNLIHLIADASYRIASGHYCLYGFSYAIRRDVYVKAGKIDKTLSALDDVDLSGRVKKYGMIKLVRNLPVLTSNRRYKNGLVRGVIDYAKPLIQLTIDKKSLTMSNSR